MGYPLNVQSAWINESLYSSILYEMCAHHVRCKSLPEENRRRNRMIYVLMVILLINFYVCMMCFVTENTKVGNIALMIMLVIAVLLTVF